MTSQGNALRRHHSGDVTRNEGNTPAKRRVVTAEEVAACIRGMIGEPCRKYIAVQGCHEVSMRFALTHPRDIRLIAADFQPLSLITRDDVIRTVPWVLARGIEVTNWELTVKFLERDVVVTQTPYMPRDVTELHVDRQVIRYLHNPGPDYGSRRLAYGESIY